MRAAQQTPESADSVTRRSLRAALGSVPEYHHPVDILLNFVICQNTEEFPDAQERIRAQATQWLHANGYLDQYGEPTEKAYAEDRSPPNDKAHA
jgi:hypothetical protein